MAWIGASSVHAKPAQMRTVHAMSHTKNTSTTSYPVPSSMDVTPEGSCSASTDHDGDNYADMRNTEKDGTSEENQPKVIGSCWRPPEIELARNSPLPRTPQRMKIIGRTLTPNEMANPDQTAILEKSASPKNTATTDTYTNPDRTGKPDTYTNPESTEKPDEYTIPDRIITASTLSTASPLSTNTDRMARKLPPIPTEPLRVRYDDRSDYMQTIREISKGTENLSQTSDISQSDWMQRDFMAQVILLGRIPDDLLGLEKNQEFQAIRMYIREAKKTISAEDRIFPIRTTGEATDCAESMIEIQKLMRTLQSIPEQIMENVNKIGRDYKIEEYLMNDMRLLLDYAGKRIEEFRAELNKFDRARQRVADRQGIRLTRNTTNVISRDAPIPLRFFDPTPVKSDQGRETDRTDQIPNKGRTTPLLSWEMPENLLSDEEVGIREKEATRQRALMKQAGGTPQTGGRTLLASQQVGKRNCNETEERERNLPTNFRDGSTTPGKTTREDLQRHQRELDFPSVRRKIIVPENAKGPTTHNPTMMSQNIGLGKYSQDIIKKYKPLMDIPLPLPYQHQNAYNVRREYVRPTGMPKTRSANPVFYQQKKDPTNTEWQDTAPNRAGRNVSYQRGGSENEQNPTYSRPSNEEQTRWTGPDFPEALLRNMRIHNAESLIAEIDKEQENKNEAQSARSGTANRRDDGTGGPGGNSQSGTISNQGMERTSRLNPTSAEESMRRIEREREGTQRTNVHSRDETNWRRETENSNADERAEYRHYRSLPQNRQRETMQRNITRGNEYDEEDLREHEFINTVDQSDYSRYRSLPQQHLQSRMQERGRNSRAAGSHNIMPGEITQGTGQERNTHDTSREYTEREDQILFRPNRDDQRIERQHIGRSSGWRANDDYNAGSNQYGASYTGNQRVGTMSVQVENKIRKIRTDLQDLIYSTNGIKRIIKKLSNVHDCNYLELQDILSNIESHNKSGREHRKLYSNFMKAFIDTEYHIRNTDYAQYQHIVNVHTEANMVAMTLGNKIGEAEDKIAEERITVARMSTQDAKEIIYFQFSGGNGIDDKNVWEFLAQHERNHRLSKTDDSIKADILRKNLVGHARLSIPEGIFDYNTLKRILIDKFGNTTVLLKNIYNHHRNIGSIPSKNCPNPPWEKIDAGTRAHLTLIRKANELKTHSIGLIGTAQHNNEILEYLCHEDKDNILELIDIERPELVYEEIVKTYEKILMKANRHLANLAPPPTAKRTPRTMYPKDTKPSHGTSEYGMMVINKYPECKVCLKLQELGNSQDYFENHLISDNNLSYNNNCPNYLKMTIDQRNDFLDRNNFCKYCVNPRTGQGEKCKGEIECKKDNLRPNNIGTKKHWICTMPSCPERIENCKYHREKNSTSLQRKVAFFKRHNLEFGLCIMNVNYHTINHGHIDSLTLPMGVEINAPFRHEQRQIDDQPTIEELKELATNQSPISKVREWLMTQEGHCQENEAEKSHEKTTSSFKQTTPDEGNTTLTPPCQIDSSSIEAQASSKDRGTDNTFEISLQEIDEYMDEKNRKEGIYGSREEDVRMEGDKHDRPNAYVSIDIKDEQLRRNLMASQAGKVLSQAHLKGEQILAVQNEDYDRPLLMSEQTLMEQPNVIAVGQSMPIFMMMRLAGVSRGINLVFDTACTGVILQDAIPGRQLKASKSNDETIELEGLGSKKSTARKWTISLPHKNKNVCVVTQAFSVENILGPLPPIDLTSALNLVKEDALMEMPENVEIQRAQVYSYMRGNIEILCGIRLNSVFPEPVHALQNGLTLYKLKLRSQNPMHKYCLGGPYFVLNEMEKVFPESAQFLREVNNGLSDWRKGNTAVLQRELKTLGPIQQEHSYLKTYQTESYIKRIEHEQLISKQDKGESDENQELETMWKDTELCLITTGEEANKKDTEEYDRDEDGVEHVRSNQQGQGENSLKEEDNDNEADAFDQNTLFPELNASRRDKGKLREEKAMMTISAVANGRKEEIPAPTDDQNANKGKRPYHELVMKGTTIPIYSTRKTLLRDMNFIFEKYPTEYRCENCHGCSDCKNHDTTEAMSLAEHQEEYYIRKSVKLNRDAKKFEAKLPIMGDPEILLAPNETGARSMIKKVLSRLKDDELTKSALRREFDKLLKLGKIIKLSDMSTEDQEMINSKQKYVIPWGLVTKEESVTTPERLVFNASSRTKTGKSLNDILAKGAPRLNFDPIVISFVSKVIGLAGDLSKFYMSADLDREHYHLQCILWQEDFCVDSEPEIYIMKSLTFGLKSSSRQLEHMMDMISNEHKEEPELFNLLTLHRFVDDLLTSVPNESDAKALTDRTTEVLGQYGFSIKAWCKSYEHPSTIVSINGELITGGYRWRPYQDVIFLKMKPLHFSREKKVPEDQMYDGEELKDMQEFVPKELTLRMVVSKIASMYDPLGLVTAWKAGAKNLIRLSTEAVGCFGPDGNEKWDNPLPEDLRSRWIVKFHEMEQIKLIGFQRNTLPKQAIVTEQALICFVDAGEMSKNQYTYILSKIGDHSWHSQLIYAKTQLRDTGRSIPNEELDSLHNGAILLHRVSLALPDIRKKALAGDSEVACFWVQKKTITLSSYLRHRVANITRLMSTEAIYHVPGKLNVADVGTKTEEPVETIMPGSYFQKGPEFLKLGIEEAIQQKYLKQIKEVTLSERNRRTASDGLAAKCKMPSDYLYTETNSEEGIGKVEMEPTSWQTKSYTESTENFLETNSRTTNATERNNMEMDMSNDLERNPTRDTDVEGENMKLEVKPKENVPL